MTPRIVAVKALSKFNIWIRFRDGTQGTVDLSDLAGKGVFARWKRPRFFRSVFVDKETGTVAWPGGIDLAPESLYRDVSQASTAKAVHA